MTTVKPKWWQSWIVYALVALVALLVPYVGGYFWLGETSYQFVIGKTRTFKYNAQRIAFGPAGWIEAKVTGESVQIDGPEEGVIYFPDGDSTVMEDVPGPPTKPFGH